MTTDYTANFAGTSCFSPKVSIIIPVYNEALRIRACLESLEKQVYPSDRFEILIVDNNSTDKTDQIAGEYAHVSVLYERKMQSPYAARNTAIIQSTADIVAFIDADCVASQEWLSQLVEPFKDSRIAGVGGKITSYQATNAVERFIQNHLSYEHCDKENGRFLTGLITANAAYRREDVIEVGLFNTMFDGSDIDLSWRIQMRTGKNVVIIPNATVYHAHRASENRLFWWEYRMGFGAVLMSTIYKHVNDAYYNPKFQRALVLKEIGAITIYIASICYRSIRNLFHSMPPDADYLEKPRLFLIAESGSLWGRLAGIINTGNFRKDIQLTKWEEPRKGHKN